MYRIYQLLSLGLFALFVLAELTGTASAQRHADRNPGFYEGYVPTPQENSQNFDDGVKAYDEGDKAKAFDIWLPLARNNDPAAMRNVAHMLRRGVGTERDINRAIYFYERASDMGLVGASANLGLIYMTGAEGDDFGDPVPQSDEIAIKYLGRAAEAGHILAQYLLGQTYSRNPDRKAQEAALHWYGQAARAGHNEAMDALAAATIALPPRHIKRPDEESAEEETPVEADAEVKAEVDTSITEASSETAEPEAAPTAPTDEADEPPEETVAEDETYEADEETPEEEIGEETGNEEEAETFIDAAVQGGQKAINGLVESVSKITVEPSTSNAPRPGGRNR